MRRFGFQNDPFHRAKRPVLHCETARLATLLTVNGLQTVCGLPAEYQKTKFCLRPQDIGSTGRVPSIMPRNV